MAAKSVSGRLEKRPFARDLIVEIYHSNTAQERLRMACRHRVQRLHSVGEAQMLAILEVFIVADRTTGKLRIYKFVRPFGTDGGRIMAQAADFVRYFRRPRGNHSELGFDEVVRLVVQNADQNLAACALHPPLQTQRRALRVDVAPEPGVRVNGLAHVENAIGIFETVYEAPWDAPRLFERVALLEFSFGELVLSPLQGGPPLLALSDTGGFLPTRESKAQPFCGDLGFGVKRFSFHV